MISKQQALQIYAQEARQLSRNSPSDFNLWTLLRCFPAWYQSLNPDANPLEDRQPWITFPAIQFLQQVLNKNMRVYEYGVGGSTLFFAQRAKEVVSVEHDPNWATKVIGLLNHEKYSNYQINVFEPAPDPDASDREPADINSYISSAEIFKGFSFKNYVQSIDRFPDQYFDLVLIDGRARPSCCKHAIAKLRHQGYLVLDNAERQHYSSVNELLKRGYLKQTFYGAGPYNYYFWKTCVWQKL